MGNEKFLTLETLRGVAEGKLFLEAEYARCTKMYCEMLMENKDIEKAADIIQEVQIETYGSIEKKEKLDYLLYQVWIMLVKKDYVRTYILGKKIDPPHLNEKGLEDQKIKYYQLMILYYLHESMYLEIALAYKTIYDCLRDNAPIEEKLKIKQVAFENFVWFLLLAPYTNHKIDLLQIANNFYKRELEANPGLDFHIQAFLTNEVIPLYSPKLWDEIKNFEPFRKTEGIEHPEAHFDCLQKEIIHHNLKVVEMFYTRITLKRLAELCNVNPDLVETEIAEMVCNGRLRAKIDRILGIVDFRRQMQPHDYLNDWSFDIKTLLGLVEETCHLINREHVVHTKQLD
eukprot:TRINITY_DN1803_c0_g1_i1.p2 TRINITY_DN1803_c0_g1~~TRINITY_DN1803_c0_g1_i1.p2  ORF type:complete len:343 (+),score=66.12 TRINITY_DN1803_c0_g1_i1:102-1130(+)